MSSTGNSSYPDLSKLEPLDCNNYKRWSQKVLIFFEQIEIDCVLFNDPPVRLATGSVEETPPIVVLVKKNEDHIIKYEKDNKTARYHILNHMVDTLFDLFMVHKFSKIIWEALGNMYGADDAGKKKYVVGKWLGFKMVGGEPIMDQVHEFENLCTDVTNEGMKLDEIFLVNVLLEKFPPSWSEYRNHLKHKKRDMPLQEFISHMRSKEANRLKEKLDRDTKLLY
ncbi:hypothetical protein LIER_35257 [Lithospermum erythrorhizon]|uniref:Ty1-copia retrotransposon protein n=1 Tax=Lithospermum erythrorhizon TaxID=34254 RepID=A0AAV3NMH5_LITER